MHRVREDRQRREVRLLSRQRLELFLLARRFFARPNASSIAGDRFNPARAGGDRFFLHDPERAYLAGRPYMSATAKLHRVAVQFLRLTADLNDTHVVTVLLTKKLLDLFALLGFRVRNFGPRNRRVLGDFLVHQFFHIALLLRRERRAREVEREFIRPNVTSLLGRIARHEFVQRPVQQMRHRVVALNQFATIDINRDANSFAWFGRTTFNEPRSMDVSFATLLRVDDTKLTNFGAIMPGNVEQSTIANLSSHFRVTRRLIEDEIELIRFISRQHGFHDRLGLQKVVAEKFCRRTS